MSATESKTVEIIIKGQAANATMREMQSAARVMNAELAKLTPNTAEWKAKLAQVAQHEGKISKITNEVKEAKNAFKDASKETHGFGEILKGMLGANLIEGGIEKIKEFGADCVKEFMEAEKNANNLEFALKNIAGEGKGALNTLLEQSEKLQKQGIFSDDDIQKSQTAQLQFGLTAKQVEKLTPQILDLAAAQGIDLTTATEKVISGIAGQTKGLKQAGIHFDDTGSKTKNLSLLTEQLTKFQGANEAQLDSLAGKQARFANLWGNIKEEVGGFLVNYTTPLLDFFDGLANGFDNVNTRNAIIKQTELLTKQNKVILEEAQQSEAKRLEAVKTTEDQIRLYRELGLKAKTLTEQQIKFSAVKNKEELLRELKKLNEVQVIEDDKTASAHDTKIVDARKAFLEKLAALEYEYSLKGLTKEDKEIYAVHLKFQKLKEEANGNKEDLMRIQKDYHNELDSLLGTMNKKELEDHKAFAIDNVMVEVKGNELTKTNTEKSFQERLIMAAEFWKKYGALVQTFVTKAESIMDHYNTIQKNHEIDETKRNDKRLTAEQAKNDEYLRAKLINQKQHDAKAIILQKEHDKRDSDIKNKAFEREQKMAIAKAIINGAMGITQIWATYAEAPYIAAALTIVEAAVIGMEIAAIKSAPKPYAKGGFHDPNGYTNGAKTYNSSSGIPFIAGEAGREWIAPNWMTTSPQTAPMIEHLENIRQSRTFSAGGSTATSMPKFSNSASTDNNRLANSIDRLNANLENGLTAYLDYDGFKRSIDKIDNAKSTARVG